MVSSNSDELCSSGLPYGLGVKKVFCIGYLLGCSASKRKSIGGAFRDTFEGMSRKKYDRTYLNVNFTRRSYCNLKQSLLKLRKCAVIKLARRPGNRILPGAF